MTSKGYKDFYIPLLIVILAVILRFGNYFNRLNFSVDQGRDAIIALESLSLHRAPLLGPPSSSWAFNFGPLYYYFIIFFTALIPSIYSPWIGFTLLSITSVFLAYKIGCDTREKQLGILLSLVTAVSFAEIANSTNLLNTALVSFAVYLSFYAVSAFYMTQKQMFLVLTGFGVALAFESHLQAAPILALLAAPIFLSSGNGVTKKIKNLALTISGFFIGMIPLIIFEIQHNFAWTKSVLDYLTFGQYRFYVPVRWLTDLTIFWPGRFGEVLWGNMALGIFVIVPVLAVVFFNLIKHKLEKVSIFVILIFILEIFSLRNYRGPRSSEYLIFTHFFVIYLFSLAISLLIETKNRIFMTIACLAIFLFGIYSYQPLYLQRTSSPETIDLLNFVKQKIGKPVSFYVFSDSYENANTLYYLLSRSAFILNTGVSVALCDSGSAFGTIPDPCPAGHRLFVSGRYVLYDYRPDVRTDFKQFKLETINPFRLYMRTYNNYELIKY